MMSPARKPPDTSTYSGRFAVRLRMLREKAGLTVNEVAEQLGVSYVAVYNWEAGSRIPPLETFPTFAELYGLKKTKDILPNE